MSPTSVLAFAVLLFSVAPLTVFAVLAAKDAPGKPRALALFFAALAGAFLFAFPHESRFTGTDESMYPLLAESFAAGHPLRETDALLASLPPKARPLFSAGNTVRRATRDELFRAVDEAGLDSRTGEHLVPWFVPTGPLAASALARFGLSPRLFSPLVGTLFVLVFLLALARAAGATGVFSGVAVLLFSPLPAWFFRSLQPEAAGAALVASALAFALAFPRRAGAACAWALAFALSYHRSCGLVGIALWGLLLLRETEPRAFRKSLAGGAAGFAAGFWLMAGTTTTYQSLLGGTPEKSALLRFALPALAVAAAAALGVSRIPRLRRMASGDRARQALSWLGPLAAVASLAVSFAAGGELRAGASCFLGAFPWMLWVCLALTWLPQREAPDALFRRTAIALIVFLMPFAFFVLGHEPFTGIWNTRRLLASLLPLCVLGAFAMASALRGRSRKTVVAVVAALLLVGAAWTSWHFGAYAGRNERGADDFARALEEATSPRERTVLADSFHFVPALAADPAAKVLGVNRWAYPRWGRAWKAFSALPGEKALLCAFAPPTLEEGFALVAGATVEGEMSSTHGNRDPAPRRLGRRHLAAHVLALKPLAPGDPVPAQRKTFDGGPAGLRGEWGPVARMPEGDERGQWTREGSEVVGPVPPVGGTAEITLRAGWFPPDETWSSQTLVVRAPWGEEASAEVPAGTHELFLSIPRQKGGPDTPTDIYAFRVARPYNPAAFGLRGDYPENMGVLLSGIDIHLHP